MANETQKITRVTRKSRPSYTSQLLALEVGQPAHFRLVGSAYTSFYYAKWYLEKRNQGHFKMSKVDDTTLSVTRID